MWLFSQSQPAHWYFSGFVGTPENRKTGGNSRWSALPVRSPANIPTAGSDVDLPKAALLIHRLPPKVSAVSVQ
jgi:hypothetical protein